MKKKLFIVWTVLLISMLTFTPVYAGGVSVTWGGGSIIATGSAYGFSKDEVTITLDAIGTPYVSCIDPGDNNNVVPGQNPVTVELVTDATSDTPYDEKGKFDISLESDIDASSFTPKQWGCPNNNWIVDVVGVVWNWAKITVTENSTGKVLWDKQYDCSESTLYDVKCTEIKHT